MLDLQTVVENLGSILKGKAWVVVTSQADIDSITKHQVKGNDFSKIQGRFLKPLNLSSANADEVIKKRILEKKSECIIELESLYETKKTILMNAISFSQSTAEMKSFSSKSDFADVYPFVPYQFNLLQKVFDQIRQTGYTGKSLAHGERSLLSSFKEVCDNKSNENIDILIPFYDFYDTIENFLDPAIKRTIDQAKGNNLLGEKDVNLLKVLFLIKHVKELKANLENLTVFCISKIDEDISSLKDQITISLEKLEHQTLIHKSENVFYFLTDEEQSINKLINKQDIDRHEIRDKIFSIIFNEVVPKKFDNYDYHKVVDDRIDTSKSADLTIKIITPLSVDDPFGFQLLQDGSRQCVISSTDTLLIILPKDSLFIKQLTYVEKVNKYLSNNISSLSTTISRIRQDKIRERDNLQKTVKENLKIELLKSVVYVNNNKIEITKSKATDFVQKGLEVLVENVYNKSNYVEKDYDTNADLIKIFNSDGDNSTLRDKSVNENALLDILDFVKINFKANRSISLSDIKSRFYKKPYGWKDMTISGLVAMLLKKDEIIIKNQTELVDLKDTDKVCDYLSKKPYVDKIKVLLREKTSIEEIDKVRDILSNIFEIVDIPKLESKLYDFAFDKFRQLREESSNALREYNLNIPLPGKKAVESLNELLKSPEFCFKNAFSVLFKKIIDVESELKENNSKYRFVKLFLSGSQKNIFIDGFNNKKMFFRNKDFLSIKINLEYSQLESILVNPEPYKMIKDIPVICNNINSELKEVIKVKKSKIIKLIDTDKNVVAEDIKRYNLSEDFKKSCFKKYEDLEQSLTAENLECISLDSKEKIIKELRISIMDAINQEYSKVPKEDGKKVVRSVKTISDYKLFSYNKLIKTESDVKEYLNNLESKLDELIKKDDLRLM